MLGIIYLISLLKQKDEGKIYIFPLRVLKSYLWLKGNEKQEKCRTLLSNRLHPFRAQSLLIDLLSLHFVS